MKISGRALCLTLLALPVGAMASDEKGCDSVNWGEEVLAKFPNAEKACHGVIMKNDAVYAHYVAEIVASDSESVTVHLIVRDLDDQRGALKPDARGRSWRGDLGALRRLLALEAPR